MTLWKDWESGFLIQGMGFLMGSKFNDIVDPDPIVVSGSITLSLTKEIFVPTFQQVSVCQKMALILYTV
jgi:hypothetical protein